MPSRSPALRRVVIAYHVGQMLDTLHAGVEQMVEREAPLSPRRMRLRSVANDVREAAAALDAVASRVAARPLEEREAAARSSGVVGPLEGAPEECARLLARAREVAPPAPLPEMDPGAGGFLSILCRLLEKSARHLADPATPEARAFVATVDLPDVPGLD
jgi:hypothetical protein